MENLDGVNQKIKSYLGRMVIKVTDNTAGFNKAYASAQSEFYARFGEDTDEEFSEYFTYVDYKEQNTLLP